MASLLVVDDERNIRVRLAGFFESCGHTVLTAESGTQALDLFSSGRPVDLVVTDYKLAELNGLELLQRIKRQAPETPVVLMTAYGTIENAVAAMKAGAYDYLAKPFSLEQIQHVVERALEIQKLRTENRALRDTLEERPLLDSHSTAMRRLLDTARQAARSEATILLSGESGTGKNVLARQIHHWSPRSRHPFVVVNCTTLSEHLLESELFGHMRGAFTGAVKDKPGRLEAADGGTVFRDLAAEVAAHLFREDLFYRLNVITLRVPPLRERREDILPLAERMLQAEAIRNHRPGLSFSPDAATTLMRYRWPGNVRELRNAIERAVVLASGDTIMSDHLPDNLFREASDSASAAAPRNIEEMERELIIQVLAESPTLEDAAQTLGINASTLWRKRKRYKIE